MDTLSPSPKAGTFCGPNVIYCAFYIAVCCTVAGSVMINAMETIFNANAARDPNDPSMWPECQGNANPDHLPLPACISAYTEESQKIFAGGIALIVAGALCCCAPLVYLGIRCLGCIADRTASAKPLLENEQGRRPGL